jgi:hypothetical protein
MRMSDSRFAGAGTASPRRRLPYSLVLLAFLFILVSAARTRAATPTYYTGFEAWEGYDANFELVGQNGWAGVGSGGNGLLNGFFSGQGQQAFVGYAPPDSGEYSLFIYQPLNLNLSHAQFSVSMAIHDSTTTDRDDFYWSVYNQNADQLVTLAFDNADLKIYYYIDGANRTDSGLTFTNDIEYLLSVDLDFANNRWSAVFDGLSLATNQPITSIGSALDLGDIDAAWVVYNPAAPGDNYMVFDDYLVFASLARPPPPQLRLLGFLDGAAALRLSGAPGMAFAIDASTNFVNWMPLSTNVTTGGSFDWVDNGSGGLPRRFYRGRWVP